MRAMSPRVPEHGGDPGETEPGDGSKQSGYAGPQFAPFSCSNCTHFDGQGSCDHPQVQSDPEVNGQVESEGCCNFFKSKTAQGGQGGEDQRAGAGEAGEAGGGAAGDTTNDQGGYA
jgi:hypothetical protein